MITQNLFNKKPKTFMDYAPGNVPTKEIWGTRTTTKTKPYDPFASNVKIVGDGVTEKDYDTFFEGFNSIKDEPLWKGKATLQEPKIQKLPYRPSVDGGLKIQNLPYRPSVDDGLKLDLYSNTTPTYTQAKNSSQEPGENWLQKLYTANVMTTSPGPLSGLLRMTLGKALEDHVKEKHYERNQYNVDLPKNKQDVDNWKWEEEMANCHQFTTKNGERYIKYVSPDGKREVIFDSDWNVVTADEDIGTYNYANPDWKLEHFLMDVLPWIVYGNTPEDSTKWYERVGGLFNFE